MVGPEDDSDKFGPDGEEMIVRLQFLTSHMSKHVFEEFDTDKGLAPELPRGSPRVVRAHRSVWPFVSDPQTSSATPATNSATATGASAAR